MLWCLSTKWLADMVPPSAMARWAASSPGRPPRIRGGAQRTLTRLPGQTSCARLASPAVTRGLRPGGRSVAGGRHGQNGSRPGPGAGGRQMRIGVPLQDPSGPDPMTGLREQVQRAADDGFASAWLSNIFGLDALTALAVAGNQVGGIELGTAVVPTYPRHPAALAQQALTAAAACGGGRLVLGIGVSHKIVIEDMYGYDFGQPVRHMRE